MMITAAWKSGSIWRQCQGKLHLSPRFQPSGIESRVPQLDPASAIRTFVPSSAQGKSAGPAQKRSKASEKITFKLSDLPQGRLSSPLANKLDEDQKMETRTSPGVISASANPQEEGHGSSAGPNIDSQTPNYPTVIMQAHLNMKRLPNCVVITRVGGFYELYLHQADEFGPALSLKVSQKKTVSGPVSMSGFPFFQLERYLKILVHDLNRHVAIVEEFPKSETERMKTGIKHDRKVARIVTPGTLIDETFMDPYSSNYAMGIYVPLSNEEFQLTGKHSKALALDGPSIPLGLAWLDLSTGQFYTQLTDLASLPSIVSRVSPREIVLDQSLSLSPDPSLTSAPAPLTNSSAETSTSHMPDVIHSVLTENRNIISYANRTHLLTLDSWGSILENPLSKASAKTFTDSEIKAGSLLLSYIEDRLQGLSIKLQAPQRQGTCNVMTIDKNSLRSLEIKNTMRDGVYKGSLLHAIRRTVTRSGTRLLSHWLTSPSTDIVTIENRQNLVSAFCTDVELRDTIIVLLRRSCDSQRLVQKFALGRGNADDLLGLAATIQTTIEISERLTQAIDENPAAETDFISSLIDRLSLDGPVKLAKQIRRAIDEEALVHQHQLEESATGQMMALAQEIVNTEGTQADLIAMPKSVATYSKKKDKQSPSLRDVYGEDSEVWVMKPSASAALKKLHVALESLKEEKEKLCATLCEKHDAPSLTLKFMPGLGHICHIKGKDVQNSSILSQDDSLQTRVLRASRTTRSFYLPEWSQLGIRIDQARTSIRTEEQRVFTSLREKVISNLVKLRHNAQVLDELDIATSFAVLAESKGLVRPRLINSPIIDIRAGRHPTVEGGLQDHGRSFTRNDCSLGGPEHGSLWLITGPNMGGKSTFLRQNALLTIMAQVGCFVPAESATLGVVDAIFSRVGSADNLYQDQSTFMVEMLETAQILRHATPRSFIIMDEIGRGTTPEDGTAVAYAALKHLVTVNKSRALFATHFHSVADLARRDGLLSPEDAGSNVDKTRDGRVAPVEAYCTDVEEDHDGSFVYVHKLRPGINRHSHALKVAKLAGLPELAIKTAEAVLVEKGLVTKMLLDQGENSS